MADRDLTPLSIHPFGIGSFELSWQRQHDEVLRLSPSARITRRQHVLLESILRCQMPVAVIPVAALESLLREIARLSAKVTEGAALSTPGSAPDPADPRMIVSETWANRRWRTSDARTEERIEYAELADPDTFRLRMDYDAEVAG